MENNQTITIWDAKLYFKNFAGAEGRYNQKGDRNFGVFIDDETAKQLEEDGWNVKYTKPNEDGYQRPYLKVKVSYKGYQKPRLYLEDEEGHKVILKEEDVADLDEYVFDKIDLKIRHAYLKNYDVWTQYLDKGYFVMVEDEIDKAHGNNPAMSSPIEDDLDDIPF